MNVIKLVFKATAKEDYIELKQAIRERAYQIREKFVPEGYKQTKNGIIPEDWEVRQLGDLLIKIVGGGTPSRKNAKYFEGSISWATVKDLTDENYKSKTIEYISEEGLKNSSAKIIYAGNFIVSTRMGLGRGFINNIDMAINQDLKGLYPNKAKLDVVYLMYWYKSQKKRIESLGAGSTVKGIDLNTLRSLKILKPTLKEQQKIADILSTWDRAIELKESLVNEKEERKKGLMQKLLIPYDYWKEKRLGDISKIVTGTTPRTSVEEYYNGDYPWITPTDISDSKHVFSSERQLTEKGLNKGRFVPKESLLVTCIASIGKNAILKKDGSCNQQINAIYPSDKHSNDFLYYLISFNTNKLLGYAATTATAIINKRTFENITFQLPPLIEQQRIAKILSTADKEIELLKEEVDQLKEQKKGLMQLLLTGIVRVKEAEVNE